MTGASHAWPCAYLAVLPPSGPPVRAMGPVLRPLQPCPPPPWPHNRRHRRPPQPWPRPSGRQSIDARCSPSTPPVTVLLAARSMVETVGGLCSLLGRQDTLLAVGTRLSRWDKMGQNGTKWRAPGEAKQAGMEGPTCMLMAPGPSSRTAGATESRLPVDADRKFDPELHLRAAVASDEVHRAVRLQARESNALTSSHA